MLDGRFGGLSMSIGRTNDEREWVMTKRSTRFLAIAASVVILTTLLSGGRVAWTQQVDQMVPVGLMLGLVIESGVGAADVPRVLVNSAPAEFPRDYVLPLARLEGSLVYSSGAASIVISSPEPAQQVRARYRELLLGDGWVEAPGLAAIRRRSAEFGMPEVFCNGTGETLSVGVRQLDAGNSFIRLYMDPNPDPSACSTPERLDSVQTGAGPSLPPPVGALHCAEGPVYFRQEGLSVVGESSEIVEHYDSLLRAEGWTRGDQSEASAAVWTRVSDDNRFRLAALAMARVGDAQLNCWLFSLLFADVPAGRAPNGEFLQ